MTTDRITRARPKLASARTDFEARARTRQLEALGLCEKGLTYQSIAHHTAA